MPLDKRGICIFAALIGRLQINHSNLNMICGMGMASAIGFIALLHRFPEVIGAFGDLM
jgi:hypothetical protein